MWKTHLNATLVSCLFVLCAFGQAAATQGLHAHVGQDHATISDGVAATGTVMEYRADHVKWA